MFVRILLFLMLIYKIIRARSARPPRPNMLRGAENRLWNNNFQLDDNNQPQYPLMTRMGAPLKAVLDREVENMVKVGFLLGKKEQRPEIKKTGDRFTLSFLMPKKSQPGEQMSIPVISGKGKKAKMVEIIIQIL